MKSSALVVNGVFSGLLKTPVDLRYPHQRSVQVDTRRVRPVEWRKTRISTRQAHQGAMPSDIRVARVAEVVLYEDVFCVDVNLHV